MVAEATTLFGARVPVARLRNAEKILSRLGLKPGDALNMLLDQIELTEALPIEVTTRTKTLLTRERHAEEWNNALGPYRPSSCPDDDGAKLGCITKGSMNLMDPFTTKQHGGR